MKDALASLFSSRKFIIVLVAVLVLAVFVATGKLPFADFFSTLEKFVAVLVLAIAGEDMAAKWNKKPAATPSALLESTLLPAGTPEAAAKDPS